jgi:hypothetical protein
MKRNGYREENTQSTQLWKLNSILNGLDHGANACIRNAKEAATAVRSGTYSVQSIQLSRRIIGECLVSDSNGA